MTFRQSVAKQNLLCFQSPSCVQLFLTSWTAACQASLTSPSLPKFISIALVIPSSHLILWCPLFLLPSIFPNIRDFTNESAVCIRWPKYWSFSFSISPSNGCSGLVSFKVDWFWTPWCPGTLKSLLKHHSSKTINSSALCLLYFLSCSYMCTWLLERA